MRRDHFNWTAEADALLAELYAAGYAYSAIAAVMSKQFAVQLTRMAAIGRAGRLRFEPRRLPPVTNPLGPPKQARVRKTLMKPPPEIPPPTEPVELPPEISPTACGLMELTAASCRWPVAGSPAYLFCGAARLDGYSYCGRHHALAHQKSTPRMTVPMAWRGA